MAVAVVNGYCTLAQLKLKIRDEDNTEKDDLLNTSINLASRFIDLENESFFYENEISDEYIDVYGLSKNLFFIDATQSRIWTPAPIISISALTEDDVAKVEDTDFYIYHAAWFIAKDSLWNSSRKGIKLTGKFGYAATPGHVVNWCLTIAESISGMGYKALHDESGDIYAVIRGHIPKWQLDQMKAHKRVYI